MPFLPNFHKFFSANIYTFCYSLFYFIWLSWILVCLNSFSNPIHFIFLYFIFHLIPTHTHTHTHTNTHTHTQVDTILQENSSSSELVGIEQYISPCPVLNLSLNSNAVEDPAVILDHSDFMNFSMQSLKCITLKLYLILILCLFQ